jgi:hypothetical protein
MSVSNCFSAWLYTDRTTGHGPSGKDLHRLLWGSWLFPVNDLGLQSFCPAVAPSSQSDEALFVFRGQDCIKEVVL